MSDPAHEMASALKDAGWALYDAACHIDNDDGQAAAFGAAESAGDALIAAGYVTEGQEIRRAVADF